LEKLLQPEEPYIQQLSSTNWFFENWRFVLPEDGTRVPKHVEDGPSTTVLINVIGETATARRTLQTTAVHYQLVF